MGIPPLDADTATVSLRAGVERCLARLGMQAFWSASGDLHVRRGHEPWKPTTWAGYNNLLIVHHVREDGRPVERLLISGATLNDECPELPPMAEEQDASSLRTRERQRASWEVYCDYCEKKGEAPFTPSPEYLARMPFNVAEAFRELQSIEEWAKREAISHQGMIRRPPAQRAIGRRSAARVYHGRAGHGLPAAANAPPDGDGDDDPHLLGLRPSQRAIALIRRELTHGPRWAVEVEAALHRAGVSIRTADRARKKLGVISQRRGFSTGSRCYLSLPPAGSVVHADAVGKYLVRTPNRWGETEEDLRARHREHIREALKRSGATNIHRLKVAS